MRKDERENTNVDILPSYLREYILYFWIWWVGGGGGGGCGDTHFFKRIYFIFYNTRPSTRAIARGISKVIFDSNI